MLTSYGAFYPVASIFVKIVNQSPRNLRRICYFSTEAGAVVTLHFVRWPPRADIGVDCCGGPWDGCCIAVVAMYRKTPLRTGEWTGPPLYFAKSGLDDLMVSFPCVHDPVIIPHDRPPSHFAGASAMPLALDRCHDAVHHRHCNQSSPRAQDRHDFNDASASAPKALTNRLVDCYDMHRPLAGPIYTAAKSLQQERWSTPPPERWAMPMIGIPAPSFDLDDVEDEWSRDSTPAAGKRLWSDQERAKHSQACKSKGRLTLAEKLEIIRLFQSDDPAERKSQKELAAMFGKSRMTISTIVRPENIEWYKQLGESGVRLGAKRYKRSEPPDFERRVYEAIGKGQTATTKAEIARVAESIARSQDLPHFGELLSRAHCCSTAPLSEVVLFARALSRAYHGSSEARDVLDGWLCNSKPARADRSAVS